MATNLAQTVSSTIGATLIGILSYKPLLLIVAVVAAVAAIPVLAFPVQPRDTRWQCRGFCSLRHRLE
jgi:hypothetical protein